MDEKKLQEFVDMINEICAEYKLRFGPVNGDVPLLLLNYEQKKFTKAIVWDDKNHKYYIK